MHRASAEAKAKRIIGEELRRQGWKEADILARRKNDPLRLELAARLRRETTVSMKGIAERVRLGSLKAANLNLHDYVSRSAARRTAERPFFYFQVRKPRGSILKA